MLAALQNVHPSHLLDVRMWSALGLRAAEEAAPSPLLDVARLVRSTPSS